jgi:hypothetical protein
MSILTGLYYVIVLSTYYVAEIRRFVSRRVFGLTLLFSLFCSLVQAQTADGNNGLSQANTMVRSYYDTATQLIYAIAAICALIGAIQVFLQMTSGTPHAHKSMAAWFGSCVFLVVVATVIKSFFGL